ncbi:MAG: 23S rRNA (uracil(1939)-C(5))-methyltransferase RlmD [Metallibacterium scheffleri]|jgi:23S rRNA (uracil1939-C5)-methyltransferase|uniref:23S rRNA (uracil(1939)-C(5))-methyltransferase RlmD n=1 Tax=Metallibacterium scheffleri TaxID=993689 RepID=UPI0026EFFD4B|nr:23S rRNA (uracil(1939)-C(5))-methyltransferase RlmD [Metallibacterium scheffleri]MCK9365843.1 23S rRNA (uracil(1939)-C(5))-methyltransferase RlmD [Metallibacterium scheffleri]
MSDFETDIIDLSHDGRGVARSDGKVIFVRGALPGERVRIGPRKRHRHFDEAELLAVLTPSAQRAIPPCPHFGRCGGCVLQHLQSAAQLVAKQRVLAENFERIGKVVPQRWLAPLADAPWAYRRKGRLSVRWVEKKGRVLVGFREDNPRFVADLGSCAVLAPPFGALLAPLAALIDSLDARREIPQIEFARGDDAALLLFRHMQPLGAADRARLAAFSDRHAIALWLQPGGPDSVQPLRELDARALSYRIDDDAIEIVFQPLDFIQVNAGMNRRMLALALDLLAPQAHERVLDLFAGLGNFTLPIARRAAVVAGVEGDAGLVARAAGNATRNALGNARFHTANLFADQRQAPWAREAWDKILLDPPRAGAAELLDYLPGASVRRVVYVSCHPGSLARDAGTLVQRHGFRLTAAGVMDMFPHTAHVESIALFERD